MHKKVFGRKLGRGRGARQALFRELVKALVLHDKIVTTKAKAKAVQPDAEKVVTLAKRNTISAKRLVVKQIGGNRLVLDKLFLQIAPAAANRAGGYTRIVKLPKRLGDASDMVRIEWVDAPLEKPKAVAKKAKVARKSSKAKKVTKKTTRALKTKTTKNLVKKNKK